LDHSITAGSDSRSPRPSVICSILERDAFRTLRSIALAPAGCELLELRADHLRAEEITEVVQRAGRDVIVTIRRGSEGGADSRSEDERRRGLLAALDAGARFIDVEWRSSLEDLARGAWSRHVIVSHHGAECVPGELQAIYRSIAATGATRAKLVAVARSPAEIPAVRGVLVEAASEATPLACFAIGRAGAVTRLLAPSWGSWATYGSLEAGRETAPGQFSAKDLLETFDVLSIGAATRLVALVGNAVFGSPSPAMHRAAYLDAGLDARYLPLELDRLEDLLPLIDASEGVAIEALAVTIPFKEEAARRCRLEDEVSRSALAVNTVMLGDAGWAGYNTDGPAVLDLVGSRLDPAAAKIAIVGAGGTARAAAAALAGAGAEVTVFNRTLSRAQQLADRLDLKAAELARLAEYDWDVLVQATPLGRRGERLLEQRDLRGKLVVEAVYGRETPLVRDARSRAIDVVDGFGLLVAQAVLQFERMTGCTTTASLMRAAGREWLAGRAADPPNGSAPTA